MVVINYSLSGMILQVNPTQIPCRPATATDICYLHRFLVVVEATDPELKNLRLRQIGALKPHQNQGVKRFNIKIFVEKKEPNFQWNPTKTDSSFKNQLI